MTTAETIMNKYIPAAKREAIAYIDADPYNGGYWITLKEGWNAYGMEAHNHHTIHETTIAELRKQITRIGRENDAEMLRKYWNMEPLPEKAEEPAETEETEVEETEETETAEATAETATAEDEAMPDSLTGACTSDEYLLIYSGLVAVARATAAKDGKDWIRDLSIQMREKLIQIMGYAPDIDEVLA